MENKPVVAEENNIEVMPYEEIKSMFCPTATDKEILFFINIAKANGLNPFKREIHMTKYKTRDGVVFKIMVGYEVYLKRAERTNKMNGWRCEILKGRDAGDDKAILTIHRKDWNEPFMWEVTRKEVSKGQATWTQMPDFMLKKVAIAQGMRLCFPDEMGGMPYIEEETGYQDNKGKPVTEQPQRIEDEVPVTEQLQRTEDEVPVTEQLEPATETEGSKRMSTAAQQKAIHTLITTLKKNQEDIYAYYKVNGTREMTINQASDCLKILSREMKKKIDVQYGPVEEKMNPKDDLLDGEPNTSYGVEKPKRKLGQITRESVLKIVKLISGDKEPGKITNLILEKYRVNTFDKLSENDGESIVSYLEKGTWK